MTALDIELRAGRPAEPDAAGAMAIRAAGLTLTRLQRYDSNQEDDFAHVPLTRFGFWLADNWWRLRYETRPAGPTPADWRLAHEIGSLGGGFAWPRVTIWGEGQRIVLTSKADPPGVAGPVRFLTDAIVFIGANEFDAAMATTLDAIQTRADGVDATALRKVIDTLAAERQDPHTSAWRRMEAIAGFDCDQVPDDLMRDLSRLGQRYTQEDIEEAVAAHPGADTVRTLETVLAADSPSGTDIADFTEAAQFGMFPPGAIPTEPWQLAEQSARRIRNAIGRPDGPLRNKQLADLLKTPPRMFDPRPAAPLPYGLRIRSGSDMRQHLLLSTRRAAARRFEAVRCLGDAIWSRSSPLGPVSQVRTARQKFQKAFAASLLCPASAVTAYVGSDDPTDDDISAAARHFHVSEKVIQTIFVNKYVMDRGRLPIAPDETHGALTDDEILDAA